MSTTFELRDAVIDRTKKRLEKYRRTAEKKEIDYDAFLDEKLRNDMRETHKYLAKVNESKMRKNKSKDANKKDLPTGPGGLSQNEANMVKSQIREHIQSELKKVPQVGGGSSMLDKKRKKPAQSYPLDPLSQLSHQLPSDSSFPLNIENLSHLDIQNVLGDVKQENTGGGYGDVPTSAPVVTSPPVSTPQAEFYSGYTPTLFQTPYFQQQYNAQYNAQQMMATQWATGGTTPATSQANYSTNETEQAQVHDFLYNQCS